MSISVVTNDTNAGSSRPTIRPLIGCVYTDVDVVCAGGHIAVLHCHLFVDISETSQSQTQHQDAQRTYCTWPYVGSYDYNCQFHLLSALARWTHVVEVELVKEDGRLVTVSYTHLTLPTKRIV